MFVRPIGWRPARLTGSHITAAATTTRCSVTRQTAPRSCLQHTRSIGTSWLRRRSTQETTTPPASIYPTYFPERVYFPRRAVDKALRRKAWMKTAGRAVLTVVIFYLCYEVYMAVVVDYLLDIGDEEWENLSEKEKQQVLEAEEEDPPMIFLPWPLSRKMVQPPPYRATDPEFQEMRKLSKNQEEQKKIKQQMVKTIKKTVEKHPGLKQACGDNVKVSKYWLDILYPGHPPPQPTMGGIFIDGDGIGWTERPIDPLTAARVEFVFETSPQLFMGMAQKGLNKVGDYFSQMLGLSEPQPGPYLPPRYPLPPLGRQQMPTEGTSKTDMPENETRDEEGASTRSWLNPLGKSENMGKLNQDFEFLGQLVMLQDTMIKSKVTPPRGCVVLDGTVQVFGDRGIVTMSLSSHYDPKEKKFWQTQVTVKHVRPRVQKAPK